MSELDPELKQAMKVFTHFFDQIHQPIAVIDHQGRYIYYNQESADLDGYSVKRALGRHMLEVYPKMTENSSTMLQALKCGREFRDNYQNYYNALGKLVDYQHTTVPLYNRENEIVGAIEVGRDLSTVRALQEQVVSLNSRLYQNSQQDSELPEIVHASDIMARVVEQTKILGRNDVPVLIVGETGTGKELFARLVHKSSSRYRKPFIALNCSALPAALIESTLFGTVKGAFTGAENREGYLDLANGGTLFLDELNAMPLEMQSKLLRFLQEKTYWPIGGQKEKHSDVRIVAAMNESPLALLESGKMRSDLFYRLNVGLIKLPPLRERPDDIPVLARYFIQKHQSEVTTPFSGISASAIKQLQAAPWPGNVRMLENVIVRSMVMQSEEGELHHIAFDDDYERQHSLPEPKESDFAPQVIKQRAALESGKNLAELVECYEKQLIIEALNRSHGIVVKAAELLGISRTTLQYKVKKYAIHLGVLEQ